AVIATPAPTVPAVVRDCFAAGVRGAVVVSAGFRETGAAGAALEREVLAEARRGPLRLLGPNALGVMVPPTGLNATLTGTTARPGGVALLSQSGALLTAILDWSRVEHVGFSAVVSVGSMADVGWGDLIAYLGDDPHTRSILLYMESVGDARAFLSAAREVALRKPIIAIKAGRTAPAARAAASHTGTLRWAAASPSSPPPAAQAVSPPTPSTPAAASSPPSRRPRRPPSTPSSRPTGAAATPSTSSATPTTSGSPAPSRPPPATSTATACW